MAPMQQSDIICDFLQVIGYLKVRGKKDIYEAFRKSLLFLVYSAYINGNAPLIRSPPPYPGYDVTIN